ncbi:MAG: type II toxin-antitoxin system RelB/DinJ family antitoxin [Roseburia sp.]|nr:type II toxin-antitoxin system RelB/DinJ family antitoxin [Roseburia sp.]MCM1097454.1 type II toxin-antitoxin system RelB/DinJ family antitoxin [Ruminococcus flavefaciens]
MVPATLTARVDEKDKACLDAFCSNVGLNTSTAINLFVKAVLRENRIPFEICQTPDPFAKINRIDQAISESEQKMANGAEAVDAEVVFAELERKHFG